MKPEPFEVRYSVPKLLGWAALAGGFVSICLWGMLTANGMVAFACALGAILFAFPLAVFAIKLFDRRVQLRIADNGLQLRPHSSKTISLRSIKSFQILDQRLVLLFYKPSNYPIEKPLRRFIYKINGSGARAYFGDAWMWTSQYDCSAAEIMAGVNAHIEPTEFKLEMGEVRQAPALERTATDAQR